MISSEVDVTGINLDSIESLGLGMKTGFCSQANMGSPKGGFTPLSRLTSGNHGWIRVRVRVSRIWVASNPNTGTEYSLDCLLIDEEGVTMQARALPGNTMERLKHQLVEGKVCALSDFTVAPRRQDYMACSNGLMIYMGEHTVVDEIDDNTGSSIPLHSFEFVDFDEVPSRNGDKRLFTDVIGQIVSVEEMGETWKWKTWRNISFRNVRLHNLRGRELDVALFGDLGRNFDAEQVFKQGQKVSIVAVFADLISLSCYLGKGFTVRSTTASKYYLDLDIPEVQEFRASLTDPHKPIDLLPCQLQNPVKPADLVKSWRTIKQLKSLNPHELQNTTFLCKASLKGIDCTKGWFYWSCFHCKLSISWDGINSFCIEGCPNNPPPVPRYKLNVVMEDATGAMDVMIFDDPARKLVGAAAEELFGEVTGEKISAVICSHHSLDFVIAAANGCFVVIHILDDDELQLIGSAQVAAGGGPLLSEEEGSSVSYDSSPVKVVKKEKMVIKEEGEVEDGCESPQGGGSSASCSSSSSSPVKKEKMAIEEEREPKRQRIAKGHEAEQTYAE